MEGAATGAPAGRQAANEGAQGRLTMLHAPSAQQSRMSGRPRHNQPPPPPPPLTAATHHRTRPPLPTVSGGDLALAAEVFRRYDADGSSRLDRDELLVALRDLGGWHVPGTGCCRDPHACLQQPPHPASPHVPCSPRPAVQGVRLSGGAHARRDGQEWRRCGGAQLPSLPCRPGPQRMAPAVLPTRTANLCMPAASPARPHSHSMPPMSRKLLPHSAVVGGVPRCLCTHGAPQGPGAARLAHAPCAAGGAAQGRHRPAAQGTSGWGWVACLAS